MHSFDVRMGEAVDDAGKKGWLVAILELGAWAGVLMTGTPFLSLLQSCLSSLAQSSFTLAGVLPMQHSSWCE